MITKPPPKTIHLLTPEYLKVSLERSAFRHELTRILAKYYRKAIDNDTAIPLCVWGRGCHQWTDPTAGKLFDVSICVTLELDKFTARWWCHTKQYPFDADTAAILDTPAAFAEWQSIARYLPTIANGYAVVMFADGSVVERGMMNGCTA
jgi:hypothetical protein